MIHLITGGSGSGKSRYAEQQILDLGPAKRIYIATMHAYDEESVKRIERHRAMRAEKEFETIECYLKLHEQPIPEGANVLVECISNLCANEMFDPGGAGIHTIDAVLKGISHVADAAENLVIVTNEVFSDGVSHDNSTRFYQEYMGAINQELALLADKVTEVVYGIPLLIKEQQTETE